MNVQERKPTSAQRKALKDAGIDATKVTVRRYPNAPKEKERKQINEAYRKLHAEEKELLARKTALIREFLETNEEAAAVVAELAELRTHKEIVDSRRFHHQVEIVKDGGWCTHVLGSGDSFNDALKKARR